jgi:hypothetical protein
MSKEIRGNLYDDRQEATAGGKRQKATPEARGKRQGAKGNNFPAGSSMPPAVGFDEGQNLMALKAPRRPLAFCLLPPAVAFLPTLVFVTSLHERRRPVTMKHLRRPEWPNWNL